MERGVLPAAGGEGARDPAIDVRLLDAAEAGPAAVALKLASAFGGANAALVLARDAPHDAARTASPGARGSRVRCPTAFVHRAVHVTTALDVTTLVERTRLPEPAVARADELVRLALTAGLALATAGHALAGGGLIVGHGLATLETNAAFHARIAARGAAFAEGRKFPYTSPNAVVGECAIAFGLTGPSFAVGSGLHGALEALAVARDLVLAGDTELCVVIGVDEVGPRSHAIFRALGVEPYASGAVATLVSRSSVGAVARLGDAQLRRGVPAAERPHRGNAGDRPRLGHRALLPLAEKSPPPALSTICPTGAVAHIDLFPV